MSMKAIHLPEDERMMNSLGGDAKIVPVKENFDHAESGQVTATTGEHFHPPSQAQASANTVISSMKKRAQEESVPLLQIYHQEMTKLYGAPGCDETVVNLPSF